MPASTTDIAAALAPGRQVDEQSSSTIKTRYPGARDTGTEPRRSYFDLLAGATAINSEAFALLGVERRRWGIQIFDVLGTLPGLLTIADTRTPTVHLTDAEAGVDARHLVAAFSVDLEAEVINLELFG